MTGAEVGRLLRLVAGLGNGQQLTEDTGNAWLLLLGDVSYRDAAAAVVALARARTYVDVAAVRDEVRRIRDAREAALPPVTPNVDPDDWRAFQQEAAAIREAIRSGRWTAADVAAYAAGGSTLTGVAPRAVGPVVAARRPVQALRVGRAVAQ